MSSALNISDFLASQNLDIRETMNLVKSKSISPRFMDQKCTPDVLNAAADWILNLPSKKQMTGFTVKDIWTSEAFSNNVSGEFSKPDSKESSASSEYDKFIAQPLKTFAFAGILEDYKQGRTVVYKVLNSDLLKYIRQGVKEARIFLVHYLTETLKQSDIYYLFENFFDSDYSKSEYLKLRNFFIRFIINQTPINGEVEVRRIFPKVLNPIAHSIGARGSEKGSVSRYPINTSALLYNQENFRDKGKKAKNTTRQLSSPSLNQIENSLNAAMHRHMKQIRLRHGYSSELVDSWANGQATQVHHIFPKNMFPEIQAVPENLILLTPTQHNTKAHPRNNTSNIDFDYQIDCLIAKVRSIEISDNENDGFYNLSRFIQVINHGYSDISLDNNLDYENLIRKLRSYQNGFETSINI